MQLFENSNNAATKETKNIESSLSSKPPCPGMSDPESLTPLFRFIRLSTRSPITPAKPHSKPNKIHCQKLIATPGKIKRINHIAVEQISEGIKPSQVFLGLICGASLCLPKAFPKR